MSSKGFDAWPPIHQDEQRIHEVVEWSDEMLYDRILWYTSFLVNEKSLQERGKKAAEYILGRMKFDRDCRVGKYAINHLDFEVEGGESTSET